MPFFDFLRPKPKLDQLFFKGNEEAFQYACKFLECDPVKGRDLPCIVEELEELDKEGRQSFRLRLASNDGGFELYGCQAIDGGVPPLHKGDLAIYRVLDYYPESRTTHSMLRMPGFIVAKIEPVYRLSDGCWRVVRP
jgi:hypothetical protein